MPHGIGRWVLGLIATGLTTLTLTAEPEVFLPSSKRLRKALSRMAASEWEKHNKGPS